MKVEHEIKYNYVSIFLQEDINYGGPNVFVTPQLPTFVLYTNLITIKLQKQPQ